MITEINERSIPPGKRILSGVPKNKVREVGVADREKEIGRVFLGVETGLYHLDKHHYEYIGMLQQQRDYLVETLEKIVRFTRTSEKGFVPGPAQILKLKKLMDQTKKVIVKENKDGTVRLETVSDRTYPETPEQASILWYDIHEMIQDMVQAVQKLVERKGNESFIQQHSKHLRKAIKIIETIRTIKGKRDQHKGLDKAVEKLRSTVNAIVPQQKEKTKKIVNITETQEKE